MLEEGSVYVVRSLGLCWRKFRFMLEKVSVYVGGSFGLCWRKFRFMFEEVSVYVGGSLEEMKLLFLRGVSTWLT